MAVEKGGTNQLGRIGDELYSSAKARALLIDLLIVVRRQKKWL